MSNNLVCYLLAGTLGVIKVAGIRQRISAKLGLAGREMTLAQCHDVAAGAHRERNAILIAFRQNSSPIAQIISHHLKEVPRQFTFYEELHFFRLFPPSKKKRNLKDLDHLRKYYLYQHLIDASCRTNGNVNTLAIVAGAASMGLTALCVVLTYKRPGLWLRALSGGVVGGWLGARLVKLLITPKGYWNSIVILGNITGGFAGSLYAAHE